MIAGTDLGLGAPFIDVDEWRDEPRRHRYVHGGFEGSHTLFSIYFPPVEHYQGRFFQYLEGGAGGHESLLAAGGYPGWSQVWAFDLAFDELGGYLVESNQGHYPGEGLGTRRDGSTQAEVNLYGASAESALFAKQLAADMYGEAPHHGYVWGVSGGGLRTSFCLENRPDVWDGGAPHAGVHLSTQWPAWALAWLVARHQFPRIVDAMEPGGSGNPFEGLSHAEREAVADLYRRGWPRGAENQIAPFSAWAFNMYTLHDEDPTYVHDFWHTPGYRGADDPDSLAPYVVNERTTVREVIPASKLTSRQAQMAVRYGTAGAVSDPSWGVRLALQLDDPSQLFMAKVTILDGKAAGRELYLSGIEGDVYSPFSERAPDVFDEVEPGDAVTVDNRDFVAFCHYHRHAVEGLVPGRYRVPPELEPWAVDGKPVYPQRERPAHRPENTGRFSGKMVYVQPTLDDMVWPNAVASYQRLVKDHLGDAIDDHFRLWWVENACHAGPEFIGPSQTSEKRPGVWLSRLVPYEGVTSQALRDLVRWVEDGVAPPSYHGYRFNRDVGLELPPTATERGGVQPVVSALANGSVKADVGVGEPVTLTGHAEQPAGGGGMIVAAEWDAEGLGTWEHQFDEVDGSSSTVDVSLIYAYAEPGTYFPSFRVGAHREGASGRGLPVQNLARVRVVVTA
jgi:hypothetical protein